MKRLQTIVVGVTLAVTCPFAQTNPVFQASADLVSFDVSVRTGNNAAVGLTANDFELADNHVKQTIEMFETSSLPLDVTLAIDNSGSMEGSIAAVASYVKAAKALLRPDDRLRLITFSSDFSQLFDFQPASAINPPERITAGGATSIFDALSAALLPPRAADRRHLVVAFTDGIDTMSVLSSDALKDVSRRTDSVLYLFLVESDPLSGAASAVSDSVRRLDTRRVWSPVPAIDAHWDLREDAENTGGSFDLIRGVEGFVPAGLKRAIEEFRAGYVLRYHVAGVARAGWHDVTIRVLKPGRYAVRARKGWNGS